MRFISLLIALVLIGFLAKTQLGSVSKKGEVDKIIHTEGLETPKSVNDLDEFQGDINKLIQDKAEQRAQQLEASLNN